MKLQVTVPVDLTADNLAESLADSLRRIADSVAQFDITPSSIIGGTTRNDDGKAIGNWDIQ